ncbi:MAG TPA: hypothetical protein PKC66_07515, partial [Leptospiraceae bacterium]|nr:hypothetical protein [Leptospiraceae bacterium]
MIKNKIQKIYAAKSSLRAKLFLGFIILSLVLSSVLGFTLYQVSSSVYYKSFLQHKKSLGISISSSIDGEIFQSFITEKSSETPEFKRYFNFMQRVSANEEYITWIYSVLIDKKTNKLIYAIDATHISEDTIWIENMFIGLKVYIN